VDFPGRSLAEQKDFFELVRDRTVEAQRACGAVEHVFDVAGTTVRLLFAGERLVPDLVPALEHLRSAPGARPDVTFNIWDSESTGVVMPPPPCDRTHFTDRGDVWGFTGERYRLAFHWIEYSVNLMDRQARNAIFWIQTAATLPYWTKASPLRTLFHWWMELNGYQLLHAAAVGNQHGAMLITGKGGIGKSTTALAALTHGMSYVADDYLIVGLDPEPAVYSLYSTAKLNPDQVERFPELAPLASTLGLRGDEKAVLRLFPRFSTQLARAIPLRAIATPRLTGEELTTLSPLSPDLLHRAAAFTTMSQLPYAGRYTHDFVGRLTARVPGFELALGRDLDGAVRAISRHLASPAPSTEAGYRPARAPASAGPPPLVTVIVPVYNGAEFLSDAIQNILGQAYPSVEIIVVDDGSTDDIDGAVASLPTDLRFFKQDNSGAAAARNRGIRDASGDFIAFLDVDDLWPENNLRILVEFLLEHPDTDVVHGYGQLMELDAAAGRYEYVGNPRESFPFYIGATLFRRAAFEKVGLFDTELRFAEDTDWFNRAIEAGIKLERLAQVTLLVRRHGQNLTHGKSLVELNTLRVFKKALDRKRQGQNP
jgi:Glycosyl transferase family 2